MYHISKFTVDNDFLAKPIKRYYQKKTYIHVINDQIIIDTNKKNSEAFYLSMSSYLFIEYLNDLIIKNKSKQIVINKVLEQIRDIRPLISNLRILSQEKNINIKIIFDKEDKENKRRIWGNTGLRKKFILTSGFEINSSSNGDSYEISSSIVQYNSFLKKLNFPEAGFNYLIATTEHSDYRITGGIGSYVKECEKLYGEKSSILILDDNESVEEGFIKEKKWFSAQTLIGRDKVKEIDDSNYDMTSGIVYESLKQILFFYPKLKVIESQEALLDRSIHAKRSNLLPGSLLLVTTCHGSSFHLARAKNDMLELEQIHIAYREKRTIEDSDITVFPTKYLKESYSKVGIENLNNNNKIIRRLPFDLSRIPEGLELNEYKNIIYIGKTSPIKGFDIFLNALVYLYQHNQKVAKSIEEVSCIVTSTEIKDKNINKLLDKVNSLYNLKLLSLNREDLIQFLSKSSKDSLCLVTYPGDNHPTVVLELMALGHDFLALNRGGTPELIPNKYSKEFIVENRTESICKIIGSIFISPGGRRDLIKNISREYRKEQKEINKEYFTEYYQSFVKPEVKKSQYFPSVGIEIVKNQKSVNYNESVSSINSQTYHNIKYPINNNKVDYFLRIHAGDILDSDYISQMVCSLQEFKYSAIISNEIVPSYENYKFKNIEKFSPVNPQLGSIFLQEKYKRRVASLFKREDLISDYYDLDDWEILISLSSRDKAINIVPENLIILIRDDENIIWDHQLTQDRLSGLLSKISHFDSYILYAQLKRLDDLYFGSKLYNHLEDIYIRRDDPNIMIDVTPNTIKAIGAYRRFMPTALHKALLLIVKGIHRLGKKLKLSKFF